MKMMTKEILANIPKLYSQDGKGDEAIVHVKFFDPMGSWKWYAIEYDPKDRIFFGLVKGVETELGNFSLDELESISNTRILGIERDLHWRPRPLSEVRKALEERGHI